MEFIQWYQSLGEIWQGVLVAAGVLILFGLMVLWLVQWTSRASRRRKRALRAAAVRRGWRHLNVPVPNDIPMLLARHPEESPEDAYRRRREEIDRYAQNAPAPGEEAGRAAYLEAARDFDFDQNLALYTRGDPGKLILASDFLKGNSGGAEVCVFEYAYNGEFSDNDVEQTVLRFRSADLDLPCFSVQSEGLWEKVRTGFGGRDIAFDGSTRFSKHFRVQGKDEEAVRALFTPELLSYLEPKTGLCIDGAGHQLLVYRSGETVDPGDLDAFIEEGEDILRHLRAPR